MERHEIEQRIVVRELSPQERLLWSGQPRQGVMFRWADLVVIPFSLLWCGIAIFWEATVLPSDAPFFFKLWGVPFVLAGLYMVAGRFIADAAERKRTMYALTNERIIIARGFLQPTTKSLALRTLTEVSLSERSDGTGTILFGPSPGIGWAGSHWPGNRRAVSTALEGIDNARAVYEQVRQAQRTA